MDRIEYTSFVATLVLGTTASVEAVLNSLHQLLHLTISSIFSLTNPDSDHPFKSESPAGAIAGALVMAVMVVVVAVIALVLLVVLVLRRRQKKSPHAPDTQERQGRRSRSGRSGGRRTNIQPTNSRKKMPYELWWVVQLLL